MKKLLNSIFIVFFSLFIITGIIQFSVIFKQLYYFDIDYLNIEAVSGLNKNEIKLNYDYLIDYNLRIDNEEFNMPTITSSKEGKIHFEEVRDIFQTIKKIYFISILISLVGLYINIKNKEYDFLKSTSNLLICIPIILLLPIIINFDGSFVMFHKLMFSNDYWIFDSTLDPVINILPETFFFHMALLMLILLISIIILLKTSYIYLKKRGH